MRLLAASSSLSLLFALLPPTSARLEKRSANQKRGPLSAQYATESDGNYLLANNLWGMYTGKGDQSTALDDVSEGGETISWTTGYNWAGSPGSIKSFANVGLQQNLGKSISSLTAIPSSWQWAYLSASPDLVADVAYDLWLSDTASCGQATSCSTVQIMIWLSLRGGCKPVGEYLKTVQINGLNWVVWKGAVENWISYSFIAPSEVTNSAADLLPFLDYLTSNECIPTSSFLVGLHAGTEAFSGEATFVTTTYSTTIEYDPLAANYSTGGLAIDLPTGNATDAIIALASAPPEPVYTSAPAHSAPASFSAQPTAVAVGKAASEWTACVGNVQWGQCGGNAYSGTPCCPVDFACSVINEWFHQCVATASLSPSGAASATSDAASLPVETASPVPALPSDSAPPSNSALPSDSPPASHNAPTATTPPEILVAPLATPEASISPAWIPSSAVPTEIPAPSGQIVLGAAGSPPDAAFSAGGEGSSASVAPSPPDASSSSAAGEGSSAAVAVASPKKKGKKGKKGKELTTTAVMAVETSAAGAVGTSPPYGAGVLNITTPPAPEPSATADETVAPAVNETAPGVVRVVVEACIGQVSLGQCGGTSYTGPTCCLSGSTCVMASVWYSQCQPPPSASSAAASVYRNTSYRQASASSAAASASAAAASIAATPPNFQKFTGSLGGFFAPAVNQGGRGYVVHNNHSGASFVDLPTALQRSCGNQTIACTKGASDGQNKVYTVTQCNAQYALCLGAGV